MIQTSIQITPYLAEYIRGKLNCFGDEPLQIPDSLDLYHVVWTLMAKRQKNQSPIDTGNLTLALPDRRIGKDPTVYNYLSAHAAKIIDAEIRRMFNHELHSLMKDNETFGHEQSNLDVAYRMLCEYGITSIGADALLKNYYRYRENLRKRARRREYRRKGR